MQHVFIIGSKGIPAKYGGFETFVDNLTAKQKNKNIEYHVACMGDNREEFAYNNSHCFNIKVPPIGAAKAVYYDLAAFRYCLKYIRRNHIEHPIIYVLACRIGPFIGYLKKQLELLGGHLFVNPDGHEWKRSKWNFLIKKYWKISEKYMVKHAELLICDSKNIERYIKKDYKKFSPRTTYIAYGAEIEASVLKNDNEKFLRWCRDKKVASNGYYLVVGRFVPENNYEVMITEFMKSRTTKDLVLITNIEHNRFYNELKGKTGFDRDSRIKFVGTVYDKELLKKIREQAYGYIHGHEVGGTNPSLLESLAATDMNILVKVGFNREVGEEGAVYWGKEPGSLSGILNRLEHLPEEERKEYGMRAKARIKEHFSWDKIVSDYERLFLSNR